LLHYKTFDPDFDMHSFVPTTPKLKEVVQCAYAAWDVDHTGSLTLHEFSEAMNIAGLFLPKNQMRTLFMRIDCFQFNGEISLDEMWACFCPVLNAFLDEIQGNVEFEEATNNMQDSMAMLDELHVERRRSMEQKQAAKLAQQEREAEAQVIVLVSLGQVMFGNLHCDKREIIRSCISLSPPECINLAVSPPWLLLSLMLVYSLHRYLLYLPASLFSAPQQRGS